MKKNLTSSCKQDYC